jgi:hypothetical protein
MSSSHPAETGEAISERSLTLRLEGFAWKTIEEEAALAGLTTEELVAFSVLYYLADVDSGRISRQISRSPFRRRAGDRLVEPIGDRRAAPGSPPSTVDSGRPLDA